MTPEQAYRLSREHPEQAESIAWDLLNPPMLTDLRYPSEPELLDCDCRGRYGCATLCAASTSQRRLAEWREAGKLRDRVWTKAMKGQDPKFLRTLLRDEHRKTMRDALGMDQQKGISNPVSRYLATMGERPEYLTVNRTASVTYRKADAHQPASSRNHDIHKQPCECEGCETEMREIAQRGLGSTGKWTCGCSIDGLGSVKVGVSDSVTMELVNPCDRHLLALRACLKAERFNPDTQAWEAC